MLLNVMIVVLLDDVTPLNVTDHMLPVGRPLSAKVAEDVEMAKFAVIIPAPLTVADVVPPVDDPKVIEEEEDDQSTKLYPTAGVAASESVPPAATQVFDPADGLVVPPPAGFSAMVTWNCCA
jgi:hypothetical protein